MIDIVDHMGDTRISERYFSHARTDTAIQQIPDFLGARLDRLTETFTEP
ncbi:hypothetical protein [Actinoplanes couchii]|nr:hypothetical protein [Actinoplanes couchii]MDR6320707.1 hypothetical protein [Actinoplanes couchii]